MGIFVFVHPTEVDPISTNLALRLSDGLSLEGLRLHGKARILSKADVFFFELIFRRNQPDGFQRPQDIY